MATSVLNISFGPCGNQVPAWHHTGAVRLKISFFKFFLSIFSCISFFYCFRGFSGYSSEF